MTSCSAIYSTTSLVSNQKNADDVYVPNKNSSSYSTGKNIKYIFKTYAVGNGSSFLNISEPTRPQIPILVGPAYIPVIPNIFYGIFHVIPPKNPTGDYDERFFVDICFKHIDTLWTGKTIGSIQFSLNKNTRTKADSCYLIVPERIGTPKGINKYSGHDTLFPIAESVAIGSMDTLHSVRFLFLGIKASKVKYMNVYDPVSDTVILSLKRKRKFIYEPVWFD